MGDCSVLFDLDGTFADTAPDLAHALNCVLVARGQPPRSLDDVRPHVSHGSQALIRFGFDLTPEDAEFAPLCRELLDIYLEQIDSRTRLFPGMEELLDSLQQHAIPWGIVTNKPSRLTVPLMHGLGLHRRAGCIVSGDTTAYSKPHPEPILHACRCIGRPVRHCLYVGDAQRDIEAGRSAGARTLVALFGYLGEQDRPTAWGADGMIEHPLEVLEWLER